jgi:hypothetical protein
MDKIDVAVWSTEPLVFIGAGELFTRGITPDRLKGYLEKKFGVIKAGTYTIKLSEVV